MSIIHEALKRRSNPATDSAPLKSVPVSAPEKYSHVVPAAIGGGGVILAALLTWALSRPAEIMVVMPPAPERPAQLSEAYEPVAGPAEDAPLDGFPEISDPVLTPLGQPGIIGEPISNDFGIPVYAPKARAKVEAVKPAVALDADPAPMDLPPNAVTIEMTEANLASFTGGVAINGSTPQPGAKLRVGSEIRTTSGAASIGFGRADIEIGGATNARITRLERRIGRSGTPEEDVTLHLGHGAARTLVRPGGGSVLVSTDHLTAATQNGAFKISTAPDGSVTVINEGGTVRLIPTNRQNAPVTLEQGRRAIFRDGVFVTE